MLGVLSVSIIEMASNRTFWKAGERWSYCPGPFEPANLWLHWMVLVLDLGSLATFYIDDSTEIELSVEAA